MGGCEKKIKANPNASGRFADSPTPDGYRDRPCWGTSILFRQHLNYSLSTFFLDKKSSKKIKDNRNGSAPLSGLRHSTSLPFKQLHKNMAML